MRFISASLAGFGVAMSAIAAQPQLVDFIDYAEIRSIDMAPDGEHVLVETRHADPEANDVEDRFWLVPTDTTSSVRELAVPEGASQVQWHPDGQQLVMLAAPEGGGGRQVLAGAPEGDGFEALTDAARGVSDFALGPGGQLLVYTTREPVGRPRALTERGRRGISVDLESFSQTRLLQGVLQHPYQPVPRRGRLWIQQGPSESAEVLSEDRSVQDFSLSPDGAQVALITLNSPPPVGRRPSEGADLRLLDIASGATTLLQAGRDGIDDSPFEGRVAHSAPSWSPDGQRLVFSRTDYSYGMASVADLGVHDLHSSETWFPVKAARRELNARAIHWRDDETLLVERIAEARHGLYTLEVESGKLRPSRVTNDSHQRFSFADGVEKAAWVEQSTARPPEVHVGDPLTEAASQVTHFNARQAKLNLPEAKAVSWRSSDRTQVSGWLLTPEEASPDRPAPLLVFLAGGPAFVVTNQFSLYPRMTWAYPLTKFVTRGYAVLVVHYRGTSSFGREFRQFTLGEESVDDVQTGVETVSERADIDGHRLGLIGHSHGAGLGPLVAGAGPGFKAASFSEGMGNAFSLYLAMEGRRNRFIQEPMIGGTPWDTPERYLAVSPALQKRLVENTATLIEAGERSAAVEALQLGKGFWRHGTPHDVVLYPDSGHTLREPELMLESMQRNLEWFRLHMNR
ncbi:S9 family peptidase [Wenzhouxiangella sp. AB-CW3]|uniref:alpha/beta hydrolase family protein n=1 Tax=Wenzhouxiangella sp. AB-CW3 TaxID=2771012 RepID=UPI00168AE2F2|nr:prolyl oligopeptidase family serine peptidase [Wenzhouxiangella sp. AB-CW3]QOC21685.1 S9 family peptidase [Wenzhouxiangella sp. AB-CW3]